MFWGSCLNANIIKLSCLLCVYAYIDADFFIFLGLNKNCWKYARVKEEKAQVIQSSGNNWMCNLILRHIRFRKTVLLFFSFFLFVCLVFLFCFVFFFSCLSLSVFVCWLLMIFFSFSSFISWFLTFFHSFSCTSLFHLSLLFFKAVYWSILIFLLGMYLLEVVLCFLYFFSFIFSFIFLLLIIFQTWQSEIFGEMCAHHGQMPQVIQYYMSYWMLNHTLFLCVCVVFLLFFVNCLFFLSLSVFCFVFDYLSPPLCFTQWWTIVCFYQFSFANEFLFYHTGCKSYPCNILLFMIVSIFVSLYIFPKWFE